MWDFLVKCFCLPPIATLAIVIGLFVVAFLIFLASVFLFRKIFANTSLGSQFVEALKWPFLFVLFEIAALISIHILGFQENIERKLIHGLVVAVIATVGWILSVTIRTFFRYFEKKLIADSVMNLSSRTILTQGLFLYRLMMLAIVIITGALILMTFPYIRGLGVGILGSAGIIGIALGIAARPILLNIMAGFQIAFTKTLQIGDAVFLEGDFARIEKLHLTHVVARTWDSRRLILPISYFIDKPFQNWDSTNTELISYIYLYCDFRMPIEAIRKKVPELLKKAPFWNKKSWNVNVINMKENMLEVRVDMTANNAGAAFQLRCYMLENLVDFLQKEYPTHFPCTRQREYPT